MSGWREAIREITGEQSEPMLKKVSPSEAFSTMDRDMSASQPNPTPQVPAAPTLEQLADSEFELWQDDCCMACTSGPREAALRDILHYAMVYGQDGPVNVYEVKRTLITHE